MGTGKAGQTSRSGVWRIAQGLDRGINGHARLVQHTGVTIQDPRYGRVRNTGMPGNILNGDPTASFLLIIGRRFVFQSSPDMEALTSLRLECDHRHRSAWKVETGLSTVTCS